ncbi:Uncharacterized protein Rs2_08527 [Raphanus sativus]|nr:Uncharacterized protein Rs2_08527 [Raphanus sativus]
MAALRRCCDLPPFRLFSSRLVFQEPTFEASSTGFLGLCLCAFLVRLLCCHRLQSMIVTAFGDDAQGSVLSADLVGIIGGSIRCFAHPDAVFKQFMFTCSSQFVPVFLLTAIEGLRAIFFGYVFYFPASSVSVLNDGDGYKISKSSSRVSYSGDVTEFPASERRTSHSCGQRLRGERL